jgi:hypothetical protein
MRIPIFFAAPDSRPVEPEVRLAILEGINHPFGGYLAMEQIEGLGGHGQTESLVCMAVWVVSKRIPVLERDESPASGSARRNRSSSFPTRRFTDARGILATGTTSSWAVAVHCVNGM